MSVCQLAEQGKDERNMIVAYLGEWNGQEKHDIIKLNVARGAALLDIVRPAWRTMIHWNALNMMNCDNCVLGQAWMADWLPSDTVYQDARRAWMDAGMIEPRPERAGAMSAYHAGLDALLAAAEHNMVATSAEADRFAIAHGLLEGPVSLTSGDTVSVTSEELRQAWLAVVA